MASFGTGFLVEELLDFSSDIGEEDQEEDNNNFNTNTSSSNKALSSSSTLVLDSKPTNSTSLQNHQPQREAQTVLNIFDPEDDHHHSFPEFLEEELEWITNEDAFPGVETFDDIFPGKLIKGPNNHSPVSVLENSSSSSNSGIMICCASLRVPVPVRARSKRRRRKRSGFSDIAGQQWLWWCEPKNKNNGGGGATAAAGNETIMATSTTIGRKCWHCGAEKTPQWRAGPYGPKTLCNACGVRYKSGRLVPEYRPASSPSFSSELHSNSHRKIMEMRKQKQPEFLLMKSVDKG